MPPPRHDRRIVPLPVVSARSERLRRAIISCVSHKAPTLRLRLRDPPPAIYFRSSRPRSDSTFAILSVSRPLCPVRMSHLMDTLIRRQSWPIRS